MGLGAVSAVLGVDDALLLHENVPSPDRLPDLVWGFGASVGFDVVVESLLESHATRVLVIEENAKLVVVGGRRLGRAVPARRQACRGTRRDCSAGARISRRTS